MRAVVSTIPVLRSREDFERWLQAQAEPAWLQAWRRHCWQSAEDQPGWPESRYTRLRGFQPETYEVPAEWGLRPRPDWDLDPSYVWVVVRDDGLSVDPVPDRWKRALRVARFREMVAAGDDRLRRFWEDGQCLVDPETSRPAAYLNGLWTDGLWVEFHPADEASPALGIRIQRTRPQVGLVFPIVVWARPDSRGTLLVETESDDPAWDGFLITGLQVFSEARSDLNIQCIWNDAEESFDFVFHHARIERDARLSWATGWFGSRITQGRHHMRVAEPGAELSDIHVVFGHQRQHFDSQIFVQHTGPYTKSHVLMRGVMKDRARNVFYGLIRLEPVAQNADAYLQDHIMLLNPGAHSDSIPALEIEANQVRCGHSASVGEIDEEQLFYLQSRGLDETTARKLIVEGFLAPAIEAIALEDVRARIQAGIDRKWAQ
ncbi:FeS cluster assembly protein SufD [bacterium HR11]|nr:FeS cluster assembly protein SufD [bacterium HR11]